MGDLAKRMVETQNSVEAEIEHDGLVSLKGLKMRADELKVDVFGEVGIATFILRYSFEAGDTTVVKQDRTTMVFVKDGGEWRIAHEHLSPVMPPEARTGA